MNFAHPELLWLFMFLPGLLVWAIRARSRRIGDWRALAQRGRPPRDGTAFLMGSIALVIVALAQPRWGRVTAPPLAPGHDVVLAVDVSKSMGAEDAVPNRLAVAIEAAEGLVRALAREPANRAAVVAFAGRGVVRCPLTENLGAVLDALRRLRPGAVTPGGTDLAAALDAAREALGTEEHAEGRALVVFSDGEDHPARWSSRLERLRREDIVAHVVAIGDPDNAHPVPDARAAGPLLYRGEPVRSRRADRALEAIANQTGGSVIRLGLAAADLGELYRTRIEPVARRRRELTRTADRGERFPIFLAVALGFLIGGCWPAVRGGRIWPWTLPWNWSWGRLRQKPILAALAMALFSLASGPGDGPSRGQADSAAQAVERGQAAYRLGHWEDAVEAFDAAVRRSPSSAIARYNTAAALFQLGRYAEARKYYQDARARASRSMQTKIDYALGNTALAEGDIVGAIRFYDECLASTARGAALDAVRRDAMINRQFALEQPPSLAVPKDQGEGDEPRSPNPDRRKKSNRPGDGDDRARAGSESENESGDSPSDGQTDQDRGAPSRRRIGGAGGGRSTPPLARGDSPDDRLDAALEHIRNAQKRRLADDDPPPPVPDDGKDW